MDLKKHRVLIAAFVLLGLVGALVMLEKKRSNEYAEGAGEVESPLPAIVRDRITSIEIRRPEQPTVRLEKRGNAFHLSAPGDYPSDASNVSTLVDKLVELEFVSVASTSRSSHAALEVDDAHAIRVVAKAGDATAIDMRIGVYRGGNTMIRLEGSDRVYAVRGSIRYAFARELREWRDRSIVDAAPADVRAISFTSDQGSFRFERNSDGEWAPAAGQAAIPRFEATKVDAIVTSLARLRATDFAAESDLTAARMSAPRGTVTLRVVPAAGEDGGTRAPEEITLLLGATLDATNDVYVQRQGRPTVYVTSAFIGDRMRPSIAAFQPDVPTDGGVPSAPPPPAEPEGINPFGGGNAGSIPPEVLQQLMRQAQQQQQQQH